jgi:phosphoglycerate dehydrogenase-like enzyme
MSTCLLILTPAVPFSEKLRTALLRTFPDLTIHIADTAEAAMPFIANTDGMLTIGSAITDELLQAARELKWIQSLGTGVDGILDRPTLAPHVAVTNARGLFDDAVSECAVALMLALARDFPRMIRNQTLQRWDFWTPRLLSGKCAGIVGLGAIGTTLAQKCKALGMRVLGISGRRDAPGFEAILPYDQLIDAVREMDFLVLAAALTPQNRGLINRRVMSAMRRSSCLINVARGAMVIEDDLIDALRAGTIAGAALDAFAHEPLPEDSVLWSTPNLLISPHLAGPNDTHLERVLGIIQSNIRALRRGELGELVNAVKY